MRFYEKTLYGHTSMRNKQVEFNPYIYTLNYFIKIVPFWLRNIRFLIQNTRSLFYGRHYSSLHRLMSLHGKLNVKICLMFIVAENTGSVNYHSTITALFHTYFLTSSQNISTEIFAFILFSALIYCASKLPIWSSCAPAILVPTYPRETNMPGHEILLSWLYCI